MKGGIYFIRLEKTEDKNSLLKWNLYKRKKQEYLKCQMDRLNFYLIKKQF